MARRLGIVLLLGLVALLPTSRFLVSEVPAPVAWAHHSPPWSQPAPEQAYDILAMDAALQFLPWRDFMLDAYRAGHVPLWNPYSLGGTPFLANSQSAPLYPLHWLWPFSAEALLGFAAWAHLLIAGLGVFALCRRLGATTFGSLVAGIGLQGSAFFIAWIPLPSVLMTAAWIPWCLWAALWVAQPGNKARPIAALGASTAMLLLAGHLQIAAFGLLATAGFVIWLVAFPPEGVARARPLWAVAGLALGAALSAPQVLPVLENGRQGHRAGAATAEGWEAYRASAATPWELVTLVSPDFYGKPQPASEATGGTSHWLAYTKPGRHYAEIAFFVGPAILPLAALAFVGIRRRPQVGYFAVLAVLGLLVSVGSPVAQAMYFSLPGWSATGSPARAAVLVVLALCVLAGLGLGAPSDRRYVALLPGALGLMLFWVALDTIPADVVGVFPHPSWLWPIAVAALGAAMLLPGYKLRRDIAGLATVLGIVPLLGMTPSSPRGIYNAEFPGFEELQQAGRVAVVGSDWPPLAPPGQTPAPPNTLLPYDVRVVGGYDSLIPARYKAALDEANGEDSAPPANGNMLLVKPGADLDKLRALGAHALMASSRLQYDLPVLYAGDGWTLYSLEADRQSSFLYWESYNHKVLRWQGDFRDESRDWLHKPEADGWEMHPVSYDFATQTVVSVYRPHSYRLGFLLAMLGIVATIALYFGGGSSRAGNED